ncbi:hypothetical protein CRE_07059 [Caenorhabditis remanei]|uniref:DUF7154 domain-containing protein n=1 Tax=Caenorhabditis remanei TaxID=31234 RepID=E3NIG7_CAERE|nr:hypothetical protein CRE_07059 [Caenorhabditis remanei]
MTSSLLLNLLRVTKKIPPPACLPYQNTTVLYAYSTDIDYDTYWYGVHNMVHYADMYATMANVRFDTKQEEEIEYHSDKKSLNNSLYSRKPDSSLGYGVKTIESNLYNVLKKFLNNKKTPICGAQVFIAVKRYPDESDVSDIISQLRANRVMVRIAVDSSPSGGSNFATLYEMSLQTNGYCVFASGRDLVNAFDEMTWILGRPYQFIARNFVVSRSSRIEIPLFKTSVLPSHTEYSLFAITIQNHSKNNFQVKTVSLITALDNSFVSMNYTIASTDGFYVTKFPGDQLYPLYGTAQSGGFPLNGSLLYKWTIDYHYDNDEPQVIQLRIYSQFYNDFLPLPNF